MKKTLALILALGCFAQAEEGTLTTTTIKPLEDGVWNLGIAQPSGAQAKKNVVIADGTATMSGSGWSQSYANYTFADGGITLGEKDSIDFEFGIKVSNLDSVVGFTLVSADKTVTIGHLGYSTGANLAIATSTSPDGKFFNTKDATNTSGRIKADQQSSLTGILVAGAGDPVTVKGNIAWDADSSQFMLTLSSPSGMSSLGLGASYTLQGLNLGFDCNDNQTLSMSGVELKVNKVVPEPATATLSLLALVGLAARRRRK